MTNAVANRKPASVRNTNRSKQIGVAILGMHRSGTSALTRVLNLLGCALPEALVGPSEGNELGHWEAASVVTLNDVILDSAGSSWNDWGPMNADWRGSGVKVQMVERAAEVLREHKSLGPLFALKDPRLCRLADLWLEAADTVGVEFRVILMLRHPGEVSASLESRDLMAQGYGQLLWLRHALDAEYLSRGRKRVVCRFDSLMRNWQEVIDQIRQGLSLALPRNSPAAHAQVEQFLVRDMRHHDARADAGLGLVGASDWLKRTFEILHAWSEQGEDPLDHAELDRIRAEFDHAYGAFARLLQSPEHTGQLATGSRLRDQLSEQLAQVSGKAQEIEHQVAEIERLRTRDVELAGKVAALTAAYETMESRANARQAEADELRGAAARAAELEAEHAALQAHAQELRTAAARAAELEAERAALQAEAARASELEREVARLAAREAELASWSAELDAKLRQVREDLQGERKLLSELEQEKLRNAELAGWISAAESAALQRKEELAQLWNELGTVQQAAGAAAAEVMLERERRLDAEGRLASAMGDLRAAEAEFKAAASKAATETARERELRLERDVQLARAESKIAELRAQLEAQEQAPAAVPTAAFNEIAQITGMLQSSEMELASAISARTAAEQRVAEQSRELAQLTALLTQESTRAEGSAGHAEWLRSVTQAAERMPKWWSLLPEGWRRKRQHEVYRREGLFDAERYLQNYPDVLADGMDPIRHYILHGMAEGRQLWR